MAQTLQKGADSFLSNMWSVGSRGKEHRRSFSRHQWRRLDKTLIKTRRRGSRSHPRLLGASLPQICWCQILWQLWGDRHWCDPQAATKLCLPAAPERGPSPSPKQTSLPCQDVPPPPHHHHLFFHPWVPAILISLQQASVSARKPAPFIYFIHLFKKKI